MEKEKKKLKGQKEWDKAFDEFMKFKLFDGDMLESFLLIIGGIAIMFLLGFLNFPFIINAIIFGILIFSFLEGKPFNLKKYLPSYKRHQEKKKKFSKAYWTFVLKNTPTEGRDFVAGYVGGKGMEFDGNKIK